MRDPVGVAQLLLYGITPPEQIPLLCYVRVLGASRLALEILMFKAFVESALSGTHTC